MIERLPRTTAEVWRGLAGLLLLASCSKKSPDELDAITS
jgi:hypothetical protein